MSANDSHRWALLLLRLTVGIIFGAHGVQKVLELGVAGAAHYQQWGVPLPAVTYPLTVVIELAGAIGLTLGIYVRTLAAMLAVLMFGALITIHLPHGFFLPLGIEFVFLLISCNVVLLSTGAGSLSLDAWMKARHRA